MAKFHHQQVTTVNQADLYKQLLTLLEEALAISRSYGGYYNGRFDSAEVFTEELHLSVIRIRAGNKIEVYHMYGWFLPDSDWEAIVGEEGRRLAGEIYSLMKQIMRLEEIPKPVIERPHSVWGWIKALIAGSMELY